MILCTLYHILSFLRITVCLKTLLVFFPIVQVIIVQNMGGFWDYFTRIFRILNVLHQIHCSIRVWRNFSAAIVGHIVSLYALSNVVWYLFTLLTLLSDIWVFGLCISLSFIICLWFQSSFVLLCLRVVLFLSFISWSVETCRNIGLDSLNQIFFVTKIIFREFFARTAIS